MITESKRSTVKDSSQGIGLPDTIFAGLSFPVVPTNDITIKKHLYSQITTSTLTADEEDAEEEIKTSSNYSQQSLLKSQQLSSTQESHSQITHPVVIPANQTYSNVTSTQDVKRHLSRLYSNHDASNTNISSNLYPELPDFKSMDISSHERSSLLVHDGSISSNGQMSMNRSLGSAVMPSYPGTSISSSLPPAAIQMISMQGRTDDSDTQLISDLIAQNSQLASEIVELKIKLSLNNTRNGTNEMTDVGVDVNNPAIGVAMSGGPETMPQSDDENREKIKYISCGNCKLWFLAPKAAIFVTCPQCEAINNCGPPKNRTPPNNTVALRSNFVWAFPCLKGFI